MRTGIVSRGCITGLLSLFAALPAAAQVPAPPHRGVWFGLDPNDGSEAWIAVNSNLDFIFFDTNATSGCSQTGGGAFYGVAMGGVLDGDRLSGLIEGLCQEDQGAVSFGMALTYLAQTDEISSRGAEFYRVENGSGDAFVQGALEMRAVTTAGWAFLDSVVAGAPKRAEPPVGLTCVEPIQLISYADLRNCDLRGTIWWSGVDLTYADLRGANLSGLDLSGTTFVGADMRNADLTNTNLRRAVLAGANLSSADFTNAHLVRADLSGASLWYTTLEGANLRRAYLVSAELAYANLTLANLRNANLTGALLRDTDLTFANLTNADLTGANLDSSDLTGADLTGVTEDVNTLWVGATCPDGTVANGGTSCLDHPVIGAE